MEPFVDFVFRNNIIAKDSTVNIS